MTTTNMYSGYSEGRPTSKVVAPPGGYSNNIFGTEPAGLTKPQPGGDAVPSHPETTANRLFGSEDSPAAVKSTPPSESNTSSAPAGVATYAGNSRNHVTVDESEEDSSSLITKCRKRYYKTEGRGAYNPITGEDYPDQKQPQQQPRARQPPGGRSSGPLW